MLDDFEIDINFLLLIIILIIIIIVFYYVNNEINKTTDLENKVDNLKIECPKCPDCPDVTCPNGSNTTCPECPKCPDVKCPQCPDLPKCPKCPGVDYPTVQDIVSGIFPGRDPGISITGDYFPARMLQSDLPTSSIESNIVSIDDEGDLVDFKDRIDTQESLRNGENSNNINVDTDIEQKNDESDS